MEEIKLYTFITTIPYAGGMILIAAHSVDEARGILSKEDYLTWYDFDIPREVPDCHYSGKIGIIRWDAHEG